MRIFKISQKNHQKKNQKSKKKRDHDGSSNKVEEKDEKISSLLVKFAKRLITMQKNIGTKASPTVTFVKGLSTLKNIVGTRNESKKIFMKNKRKKGKKTFSLLLNLMLQQKAMNGMLIVVVVIT